MGRKKNKAQKFIVDHPVLSKIVILSFGMGIFILLCIIHSSQPPSPERIAYEKQLAVCESAFQDCEFEGEVIEVERVGKSNLSIVIKVVEEVNLGSCELYVYKDYYLTIGEITFGAHLSLNSTRVELTAGQKVHKKKGDVFFTTSRGTLIYTPY